MEKTETIIIQQLKHGNEEAYKYLYDQHYAVLCHVAYSYVKDHFIAETLVGDVIFHLWEIRHSININSSIRSYLLQSVRNRCINHLQSSYEKHESTFSTFTLDIERGLDNEDQPLGKLLEKELEGKIEEIIAQLSEECRNVFIKSRFEGKKNDLIAQELGISINTVKYHIKNALSKLHTKLKNYLAPILLFFFI